MEIAQTWGAWMALVILVIWSLVKPFIPVPPKRKDLGIKPLLGHQVLQGVNLETGQETERPSSIDSELAGDPCSVREIKCIEANECPDCGGEIRWGPCGGMSQNVKCFGECGRRFNYTGPLTERLDDRTYRVGVEIKEAS